MQLKVIDKLWKKLPKEDKLVERFGESYQKYLTHVLGLYMKPSGSGAFLKHVFGRNE